MGRAHWMLLLRRKYKSCASFRVMQMCNKRCACMRIEVRKRKCEWKASSILFLCNALKIILVPFLIDGVQCTQTSATSMLIAVWWEIYASNNFCVTHMSYWQVMAMRWVWEAFKIEFLFSFFWHLLSSNFAIESDMNGALSPKFHRDKNVMSMWLMKFSFS